MKPTVLLFDIDGTLLFSGGAGRRAIERAFEVQFGDSSPLRAFSFGGMTDRAIVRTALTALGHEPGESDIDSVLDGYLSVLAEEVSHAEEYRMHTGIADALDALDAATHCSLGLGTGNIREGARLKLEPLGIFERFTFGGFGSDHEDRAELIRVGAERGAEVAGAPRSECRVIIIGDTPKDIAAANAIGAESLGVATGSYDVPTLASEGATMAVEHIGIDGAVAFLLGQ